MYSTKFYALKKFLNDDGAELTNDDITEESYDHYGMELFSANGCEFAIGTDEEADEAAKQYILDTVWAFNSSFLQYHIEALDSEDIDMLRGDRCEDANDALVKLLDDEDHFIVDAISCDGRGHFMSSYDGEEQEFTYRIN